MIGVIGPKDSVAQVLHVAAAHDLGSQLISRVYEHAEEAIRLCRELTPLCHVILFTGRLPFQLVEKSDPGGLETSFVPYSGAELFKAVARTAIDSQDLSIASVDTIDPTTVFACFHELGLAAPASIALDDERDWDATVNDFVEFHEAALRANPRSLALTCLSEVHSALVSMGHRAVRVEHSSTGIHEALRAAVLKERLVQGLARQLAVGIVKIIDDAARESTYERHAKRLRVEQSLLALTHRRGGRLTNADGDTFIVTTDRGGVEDALVRSAAGHTSLLEPQIEGVLLLIGFGVGDSFAEAEANARQALRLAEGSRSATVIYPGGDVRTAGQGSDAFKQHETQALTRLSAQLDIGQLSVQRLLGALRRVDTTSFSPQQLAEAYGVQPRSIRRILGRIVDAGYGSEVGTRSHVGAGRPQTLYRVDMQQLTSASLDGVH